MKIELSRDEIMAAVDGATAHARERFGEKIDARSLDLRLWAAAALIESAVQVSVKASVMRSLNAKLDMIAESHYLPPIGRHHLK